MNLLRKKTSSIIILLLAIIFLGCENITVSDSDNADSALLETSRALELKSIISSGASSEIPESEMLNVLSDSLGNEFTVSISESDKVEFSENSVSRNAMSESESKVYVCDIVNNKTGETGFAVTSNDRRLGPVLAILPNAEFGDNELSAMLIDAVENYVEYTDFVMGELSKTDFSRSLSPSAQAATGSYKFKNFVCNKKNESNLLYTNWTQEYPYNSVVNSEIGDGNSYPVGCGAIALGQIFTRIKPFKTCSLANYSNVIYDWDKMSALNSISCKKNVSDIWGGSRETRTMIQALLREIGVGCNAKYGEQTSISMNDMRAYLDKIGVSYIYGKYDLNCITNSIDSNKLVCILSQSICTETRYRKYFKLFGSKIKNSNWSNYSYSGGHYFVIDAYSNYTYDLYDSSNAYVQTCNADFVHVNIGWANLNKSGYYLSGLFNTNNTPLSDAKSSRKAGWHTDKTSEETYGEKGYYQYNNLMLYNLYK